jgi:excisionase family DNA binding protein
MVKTDERQTLTIEEAARILGVGRSKAYEFARTGKIPAIRLGHKLLVPKAALEEFLRAARMPDAGLG